MMTAWLLVLLLGFVQRSEPVLVYYGDRPSNHVQLPADELSVPYDIAYDKEHGRILVLARIDKRYQATSFSLDGVRHDEWLLPSNLEPYSILFTRDHTLYLLMRDTSKASGQPEYARVSLLAGKAAAPTHLERLPSVDEDTALEPGVANVVRHAMALVDFPLPPSGVGISAYLQSRPDLVRIHVRPWYSEPMGWSPDLATVVFGWSSSQFVTLCDRRSDGTYRTTKLDELLRASVRSRGGNVHIRSVGAYTATVVFGLSSGPNGAAGMPLVLWLDAASNRPKVLQVAPGLYARPLQHY